MARRAPCFPNVTTLQDLASGAALAATIHCYCPQLLRLEGECAGLGHTCPWELGTQASALEWGSNNECTFQNWGVNSFFPRFAV